MAFAAMTIILAIFVALGGVPCFHTYRGREMDTFGVSPNLDAFGSEMDNSTTAKSAEQQMEAKRRRQLDPQNVELLTKVLTGHSYGNMDKGAATKLAEQAVAASLNFDGEKLKNLISVLRHVSYGHMKSEVAAQLAVEAVVSSPNLDAEKVKSLIDVLRHVSYGHMESEAAVQLAVKAVVSSPNLDAEKVKSLISVLRHVSYGHMKNEAAAQLAVKAVGESPNLDIENVKSLISVLGHVSYGHMDNEAAAQLAVKAVGESPNLDVEKVKSLISVLGHVSYGHMDNEVAAQLAVRAVSGRPDLSVEKVKSRIKDLIPSRGREAAVEDALPSSRRDTNTTPDERHAPNAASQPMNCHAPAKPANGDVFGTACQEGDTIPHGSPCTGKCRMGYVAAPRQVKCNNGEIHSFACKEELDPRKEACKTQCKNYSGYKFTSHNGQSTCKCVQ